MNQEVGISLQQTSGVECANCGGLFFEQHLLLRKIPRVLIGAPTDQIYPIPVFRCSDCSEVLREHFPDGMPDVNARLGLGEKVQQLPKSKIITMQ